MVRTVYFPEPAEAVPPVTYLARVWRSCPTGGRCLFAGRRAATLRLVVPRAGTLDQSGVLLPVRYAVTLPLAVVHRYRPAVAVVRISVTFHWSASACGGGRARRRCVPRTCLRAECSGGCVGAACNPRALARRVGVGCTGATPMPRRKTGPARQRPLPTHQTFALPVATVAPHPLTSEATRHARPPARAATAA